MEQIFVSQNCCQKVGDDGTLHKFAPFLSRGNQWDKIYSDLFSPIAPGINHSK